MAIMSVVMSGTDVYERMANNAPKDLKAACNAGGEAAKKRIAILARQRFNRGYATGETANTAELKRATKKGDGYACFITWKGNHSGKQKKPRRRAEVAFVNEYGTKKHQGPRNYNRDTVEEYGDEIQDAIEKALPKY